MHFQQVSHAYNGGEPQFLAPIRRILRDYILCNFVFGADFEINDNDSLIDAGIIGRLSTIELVGFLKSTFAISIEDDDINSGNFDTIERLARFVASRIAQTSMS
jgi:acyl carrier protein